MTTGEKYDEYLSVEDNSIHCMIFMSRLALIGSILHPVIENLIAHKNNVKMAKLMDL